MTRFQQTGYLAILNPRSLAGSGFLSVLLSIIVLSVTVGSLWVLEKVNQKEAALENIRQGYIDQNKTMLKKEVRQVIDYIHFKRATTENRLRISLREHVSIAYSIAAHIYSMNQELLEPDDIAAQIRETLRPIRWDNGLGYYFIFSKDGIMQLNAHQPQVEQVQLMNVKDPASRNVFQGMLQLTSQRDSGFYQYNWSKPGFTGNQHAKLAFIKHFEPMNWVIGGGSYLDEMEKTIQQEILSRISEMTYANNQYIFVIRYDGLILSHPMPQYHGKYLFDNERQKEYQKIRDLINISKNEDGGFVTYDWEKPETGLITPKMTYGAAIHDWEWVIGTGVYLDDLQETVNAQSLAFNRQLKNEIFLLSLAFLACLLCSIIAGFFMTRRLHKGVSAFTDFLKKAADEDVKIEASRLTFHEFEILGDLANEMVEDRISKEKALTESITEIRQLQRLLQNITDSMPSALITVDKDMNVLQWNTEAERVTGIPSEEAQNRCLPEIYPLASSETALIQKTLSTGHPSFDTRVKKKISGTLSYEDITVYPLAVDTFQGAVIRIDDTTEKVRLEEMMIQSEKMLSVGGLAAGMAHEINNPLAGIMGNVHVLENRLIKDLSANRDAASRSGITLESLHRYMALRDIQASIDRIRAAGTRAATIVSDMLTFSRQADSNFIPCLLPDLMDKTVELASTDYDLKNRFDFRSIRIVRDYQTDMPPVMCESSKIQQVFLNILTNGAQAMAGMNDDSEAVFHLRIFHDASDGIVEIEDNGPGMDDATVKRVFEPFFTTKEVGLGTGLGLSVSYFIIADHHKGHLSVTSTPGKGTCFTIRLPLSQPRDYEPA